MSYDLRRPFGALRDAIRRPRNANPAAIRFGTCPTCGRDDIEIRRIGHRQYQLATHVFRLPSGKNFDVDTCSGSEMRVRP